METLSALLALCAGNSPVTGEFPSQRPVTRSFDVFYDLHLNKCLSKQSKCRWFEMKSRSSWRHCNGKHWWNRWVETHLKTCSNVDQLSVWNTHYRHPIARLWGQAMRRHLWVQCLWSVLYLYQWCVVWYHVILNPVIIRYHCINTNPWIHWLVNGVGLEAHLYTLTHWGRDKMAGISQTTFSNAFFLIKLFEFRLKFHWSLFPRALLTLFQHWFR